MKFAERKVVLQPLARLRRIRNRVLLSRAIRAGLVIGHDVRLMDKPRFGSEPYLISIGNHVTISYDVRFVNHDGATWIFRDRPEYQGLQRFGRIDIEDNCFIGVGAILLPGIRIGTNSIVGAGSVVTKSVPPNTVVAGVPARPICTLDEYVPRAVDRSTYYPPEVAGDPDKLSAALLDQFGRTSFQSKRA